MNEIQVFEQIRIIISTELEIDPQSIQLESNPNSIKGWDSISNIRIIDSIENAFKIEFSIDVIYEAKSIQDLVNYTFKTKK